MKVASVAGTATDPGYWEVIFDVIPFPVYVADVTTRRIICANRAMRQRTGAAPGQICHQAIYRQDSPCIFCKVPELLQADPASEPCIVFDHFNDVDDRWYQLRESLISWFDGRRGKYSIAVDISPLKEVQNALAEAHAELALRNRDLGTALLRAEDATQAKSRFLAAMSHEIRTPMNAVIGLTDVLLGQIRDPEHLDHLTTIAGAAGHLMSIINDILDLSKIEAGKLAITEADFDLAAMVEGVRAVIADKARTKGIELRVVVDPAIPNFLCGDRTRLSQAILNYLGNAMKFTERGYVALHVRAADLGGSDLLLRFEVEDTGIGIATEDVGRLFDAFEQVATVGTSRDGGTGLGLAINRELAQLMGGEVGVESEPGRGSRFWFTARLHRAEAAGDSAALSATAPDRQVADRFDHCRVLLVEDNPVNRKVALALLAKTGLAIDIAENGKLGVEMAQAVPYDLILMDVHMPLMNGLDAARAIRALPDRQDVPIVAMTANAFDDERRHCLEAGMNDHLGKPVRPQILYSMLLKWLPPARA
ncbi:MAG: response regulator [Magnetospirillum sp.]|nr:response regulator [Magnetospirillum sp.]